MNNKLTYKQQNLIKKAQEVTGITDMSPEQLKGYSGKDNNVKRIVDDYNKEEDKNKKEKVNRYISFFNEKYTFSEMQDPILVIKKSWRTDYNKFYKQFHKKYNNKLYLPKKTFKYIWIDNTNNPNNVLKDYGSIIFAPNETILFIRNEQPRIALTKINFYCDYIEKGIWNIIFKDGSMLSIREQ